MLHRIYVRILTLLLTQSSHIQHCHEACVFCASISSCILPLQVTLKGMLTVVTADENQ